MKYELSSFEYELLMRLKQSGYFGIIKNEYDEAYAVMKGKDSGAVYDVYDLIPINGLFELINDDAGIHGIDEMLSDCSVMEEEKKMTIGEKIRKCRMDKGLMQCELAEKAYICQSALCNIEKGRKDFTIGVLRCIAGALDMTMSELLEGIE